MSAHRRRQIDRDTAERLLRGAEAGGHSAGNDAVAGVLAAIAVPTHTVSAEHVLAGEEEAVTAFREARVGHALAAPKKSVVKVAVASLLTWKALAAAGITASAIGGAAIVGGGEPGSAPPTSDAPTASRSPSSTSANAYTKPGASVTPSSAAGAPDSVPGTLLPSGNTAGASVPTSEPDSPAAAASRAATSAASPSTPSPSPSLEGLCRAYRAQGGDVLQNPAFDTLVEAAGKPGKVADYCDGVLGAETSDREPNKATSTPTSESSTTNVSPPESGSQSSTQPAEKPAPARGNTTSQSTP
jgi:hypothetical protein